MQKKILENILPMIILFVLHSDSVELSIVLVHVTRNCPIKTFKMF